MTDMDALIRPPLVPEYVPKELKPRPWLVRLITEHNPFYLLSAACMLASCLMLSNTTTWNPIATSRLLKLIVTLNVYEAALLGIALFLVTRRGQGRDGRILLLLQAFFLADFTFLNAEIANDPKIGWIVNLILFVLAAIKIGVVIRVLRPTFTPLQYGFVLLQLGLLFAIPCLLRWMNARELTIGPKQFYGLWWLMAFLPALYEVLSKLDKRRAVPLTVAPHAQAAPVMTYLGLPYLALATHLGILHYVYNVTFFGAHAAPALLGLALVINRLNPTTLMPRKDLLVLRLILPLAAVLVSCNNPFVFPISDRFDGITFTPLRFAIDGAYLVYVYCFLRSHAALFVMTGAVAEAIRTFGPSQRQLANMFRTGWDWSSTTADKVMPQSVTDWGVVGLVASFVFLAVGFWISMRRRPMPVAGDNGDAGS